MSQAKPTLIVLIALAVTILPVFADTPRNRMIPPKRFDHPHPNLQILEFDWTTVERICSKGRVGYRAGACSMIGDGKSLCTMILPKHCPDKNALFRHEQAHCNGWPAHHPY